MKSNVPASRSFDLSDELEIETISYLDHIANAYRNVLIAYLHNILDAIESNTDADESMLQSIGLRSLLGISKDEAISACVQDVLCVPDGSTCAVGLVPLLFIVASETKNQLEFDVASERLTAILKIACLGNIATTLQLLREMQRATSVNWRQVLKGYEWDLIVT